MTKPNRYIPRCWTDSSEPATMWLTSFSPLMRRVLLKRVSDDKVANERPTTSLVVRDLMSYSGIAEDWNLLRCYAVSLGRLLPEIRIFVAPLLSGSSSENIVPDMKLCQPQAHYFRHSQRNAPASSATKWYQNGWRNFHKSWYRQFYKLCPKVPCLLRPDRNKRHWA